MPDETSPPHDPAPMNSAREAAAIDWHLRVRDPEFSDWDGFLAWLEAAPENNAAYDHIALIDDELPDRLQATGAVSTGEPENAAPLNTAPLNTVALNTAPINTAPINGDRAEQSRRSASDYRGASLASAPANDPAPANDMQAARPARAFNRRWFGGALAAALVAAIALPNIGWFGGDDLRRIETAAGQSESITLADGSRIDVNGGSLLELDEKRPRFARLHSGEAMFHVVHRDDAPFVVESGGARIVDLGTAFNVVRTQSNTSVAVSEGMIVFNPDSDNVRMRAGQALDAADQRTARPQARNVDVAAVGGWRSGLLVYNGAPLSQVVADLHRTTGMEISVSVDAADMPFRGALTIAPDSQRTVEDLAALSGTRALRQGRGWMLSR